MKVIHLPFSFHPDPVGGTEVYVEALAQWQQQQGLEVIIAAPSEVTHSYSYNQLLVYRFAISQKLDDLRAMYGEGDRLGILEFSRLLDQVQPDIVHVHAFTRGVSLGLIRAAKKRNIPVVFTYHTPTVSCQRGTLLQWGQYVCNGQLTLRRCTACTLHGKGIGRPFSTIVGALPPALGSIIGQSGLQGSIWTAVRMSELVHLQQMTVNQLFAEVDRIVALCRWVKDLLLINDVAEEKITVCRHGLPHLSSRQISNPHKQHESATVRIVFLGRLDPTKGVDLLVSAIRNLPNTAIQLDIYGIDQSGGQNPYLQKIKNLAAGDTRIVFKPPAPSDQVINLLREYDLLAVPSRWLETGPLVVLEAFAAGIPVIGSNLGGIAEWVQDGVNGMLVETTSVEAWCQALNQIWNDRAQLSKMTTNVKPPRSMTEVAGEMVDLYKQIIAG